MIIPHQLNLSETQIKKLQKGSPVQISFDNMGADKGNIVIGLNEENAKKIFNAYKKGKGCRMCMNDDELDYSLKSGSGFSVNSLVSKAKDLGKKVEKGAVKVGNQVGKEAKKVIAKIPAEQRQQFKNEAIGLIGGVGRNLGNMIGEATGDEELGGMVQNSIVGIGDELLSGKKLKVGSKVLPIAKRAVNNTVEMIEDDRARMIAKSLVKKAGMGLYGKAGEGLRGSGLSGGGLSGNGLSGRGGNKTGRPTRNIDMREDYIPLRNLPMSGEGFNLGKAIGSEFKKGARATKTALFGKRMGDEMAFILPVAGATMGAAVGGLSGPIGATFGSSAGAMGGKALADDMKRKGYGVKRKGRFPKGSPEAKAYMASIRKGKGFKIGNVGKAIGSEFKKGARASKQALFGDKMSDEMAFILPVAGATMGAAVGGLSGPIGATFGSSAGAMGGRALAEDMKRKGYGVKKRQYNKRVLPAPSIPTYSPYALLTSPQMNPFVPISSFNNGGNGENIF